MKRIIFCVWALMTSMIVFAQDIIVTTNAKKMEVKVLQVSKTEIMYRENNLADGPIFVIPVSDVNTIIYSTGRVDFYNQTQTTAPQPAATQQQETPQKASSFRPRYQGFVELSGYVTNENYLTYGGLALDVINGVRFNDYIYTGVGVGEHCLIATDQGATFFSLLSPFYADFKFYIPTPKLGILPFAETSIGAMINYHQSTYYQGQTKSINELNALAQFRANIGLEINRFILGAGYELWGNSTGTSHFFFFKIGGRFGKK